MHLVRCERRASGAVDPDHDRLHPGIADQLLQAREEGARSDGRSPEERNGAAPSVHDVPLDREHRHGVGPAPHIPAGGVWPVALLQTNRAPLGIADDLLDLVIMRQRIDQPLLHQL